MRHLAHFLLANHDIINRLSQINKIIRISARNVLNFEIQKRCFYDFLGRVYGTYFLLFQTVLGTYQNSNPVFLMMSCLLKR